MSYLKKRQQQALTTSFSANVSTQELTFLNGLTDITNSEITYTPPTGNFQYVVFEYTIQYMRDPDTTNSFYYELREKIASGSYAQLGNGYRVRVVGGSQNNMQDTISGRFYIPIYAGTRTYKMTAIVVDEAHECTLHSTRTPVTYSPIYQMYCI